MKSTAAVLAGKNQVYVKEVELPEIGEEELLVKVVNCDEEYRFERGLGCCQRRSPS